jgi:hypothetical protein
VSLAAIVAALSAELMSSLVTAKLPPLTDGKILVGEMSQPLPGAPPRVVMVPKGSDFEPGGGPAFGGAIKAADNASGLSPERRRQHAQRPLRTDVRLLDVFVQGPTAAVDSAGSWDMTTLYAHLVMRALEHRMSGCFEVSDGEWPTDVSQAVQGSKLYSFRVAIRTPVLDDLSSYVPEGTTELLEAEFKTPSGSTEIGFEEEEP